ncbi:uncharacterized protein LOC133887419 [Phragmites australis]|uniref:uncharacterized protein LOC133887419 n=1 Tax=Phragmites australis TaxID=29695 RepID=UPI002D79AFF0|nr:uncharacterized protein LOC133887419 [Phragmites australis]
MAEMVSSAVVQEAVSQVLSSIRDKYEGKSNAKEHMERMEMAHIKLEAAFETSDKWNVTSAPLLRWRSKLKRAVQECDDTLRRCKQRSQGEEEGTENGVRKLTFPKRIAHTAKSFVSSIFNRGDDELSGSTVRRFEWFADGASEFLRYVELGGTPRQYMFFDPLVRHLLAGKGTEYSFVRGDQHLSFFLKPFSPPEHGIEGSLKFSFEDGNAPENNFLLGLHFRLSESTDIVGVVVRCLQLFTPHLRSTSETVKTTLTQLPTQDFYWAPYIDSSLKKHWNNLHNIFCKWFRPDPLCCQQHDHRHMQSYAGSNTSSSSESFPCDTYLEPVTEVFLLGHVPLSPGYNKQRAVVGGETCPVRDVPYLKLGGLFSPHASAEDLLPAVGGSATEMLNGEAAQRGLYANISFEQLGEIMLPKAVDCLCRNAGATSYQMLWKSKHGGAYLRVQKTACRATSRKGRGRNRLKRWGMGVRRGIAEFLGSWVAHAPAQLQGSIADWIKEESVMQLALDYK